MLKIAFCTCFVPKSTIIEQLRISIKSFCKYNNYNVDWYIYTNSVSYVKYRLRDINFNNVKLIIRPFNIPDIDRSKFCSNLFKEKANTYEYHEYVCNYWEWTDVCLSKVFGLGEIGHLDEYNIIAHIDVDTLWTGNFYTVLEEFYESKKHHLGCVDVDIVNKKDQIDMGACFLRNTNLTKLKLRTIGIVIEKSNFGFNNCGPEEVAMGMLNFTHMSSTEIWGGLDNFKTFKTVFNMDRIPYLTHLHASTWLRNPIFFDNDFKHRTTFDINKYPFNELMNQLVYMVIPYYYNFSKEFNEDVGIDNIIKYILEHYDISKYKTDINYIEDFWSNISNINNINNIITK